MTTSAALVTRAVAALVVMKIVVFCTAAKHGTTALAVPATVILPLPIHNIFRNYEHRWIYDYEELRKTAMYAGIPPAAIRRSRDHMYRGHVKSEDCDVRGDTTRRHTQVT